MTTPWRTGALVLVILLVAAVVAAQIFLPSLLQARLEGALAQALQVDGGVDVELASTPAVALLRGVVHRARMEARGATVDGLRVDTIRVEGRGLRVDWRELARTGRLELLAADRFDAVLAISETDLDRFVKANVPVVGDAFETSVEAGRMRLHGELPLPGQRLPVAVEGSLQTVDRSRIDFIPSRIALDTVEIPPLLLASAMQMEDFRVGVDLMNLPVPLEVAAVKLEPGWVTVEAYSPLAPRGSGQ